MTGTLYIVATPIGNLEDITLRAIRILREVDLILAEDTRVTKKLLSHYDIDTPTLSYHQHSKENKKLRILRDLNEGKKIALVTDAGTPGISDPGNELIDFLYKNTSPLRGSPLKVIPVPGASALTTALSISGLPANKFIFLGFLPKRKKMKLIKQIKLTKLTFVFYESPKRIVKTLEMLSEHFGSETTIVVARELTKLHESIYRGTLSDVRSQISDIGNVKGEIVVVVG